MRRKHSPGKKKNSDFFVRKLNRAKKRPKWVLFCLTATRGRASGLLLFPTGSLGDVCSAQVWGGMRRGHLPRATSGHPTWEAAKWEVSPNFPNCPHFLPQERNQHGAGLASCFSARGWALLGGVLGLGAARAEQAAIPLLPRGVLEHFFLNRDLTSGVFPFFLVFLLEWLMLIYC